MGAGCLQEGGKGQMEKMLETRFTKGFSRIEGCFLPGEQVDIGEPNRKGKPYLETTLYRFKT